MTASTLTRYIPLMVSLHWLITLLIFTEFALGKYSSLLSNDAREIVPLGAHMLPGLTILVVIVFRFIVRMRTPRPAHAFTGSAFLNGLGKVTHYALCLFVFLMAVSGVSLSLQAGLVQTVFGGVGSLLADFFVFTARVLHKVIAPVLLLLILLHIGGALYHQFVIKDKLFARMSFSK